MLSLRKAKLMSLVMLAGAILAMVSIVGRVANLLMVEHIAVAKGCVR